MFDQNQNNQINPNVPTNPPVGPSLAPIKPVSRPTPTVGSNQPPTEDIFAETEKPAVNVPSLKKITPAEPLTALPDDLEDEKVGGKKFLFAGLAVVAVIILAVGGYYAYGQFFNKAGEIVPLNLNQPAAVNTDVLPDEANLNTNANQAENPNINQDIPVAPAVILDSDKDGLTDDEERTYGTDINEPDSDGDGLFDKEEVKVYLTNPLDPDTDQDGYLDGAEVKSGYNPNGAGKLLDMNFQQ